MYHVTLSHKSEVCMNKEDIDMAYIAGVMDGDGSFSIQKLKTKRNPLYFALIQCGSWRTFIEFLKEKIGGNIVMGPVHICKNGTKGHALKKWKIRSNHNVLPVLEKIIPFLKIKKERAEFLRSFINSTTFVRGQILSKEELARREKYYIDMIQFNDWKSCSEKISNKSSKNMSDDPIFWSYMGGMMDTDGSFAIKKQMINKGTDVKNPRYLPIISLSSTDTRAINYLRENCNVGKLYLPKNKATSAGYHYQFGIYTKLECIEFLKRIIPYIKSKKEQCQILLDFCENSHNTKYCKAGIPEQELIFREDCYQRMIQLNKYGVYKPSLIGLKAQNWVTRRKQSDDVQRERLSEKAS